MASLVHAGEPMPHGAHPADVATSTTAPAENTAHATAAAKAALAPPAPHATAAAAADVGVFLDTYPANGPCEDTMLINHEDSVYCVFDGHGGPQCSTYLQEHFPHAFARVLHRHRNRVGLAPQPLEPVVDTPPTQPTSPTEERVDEAATAPTVEVEEVEEVKEAARRPSDDEYTRAMDDVMTETFLQLDHQWAASGRAAHARSSGSCGLVTHVNDERRIITVASVGDCRAVVARRSADHASGVEAMPLSVDQTCKNVLEVDLVRQRCSDPCPVRLSRVDQLAGVDGMLRVAGSLAVTRAFGDMYLKLPQYSMPGLREHVPYITCKPAVTSFSFTPDDEFIVLASDGLWDHFSSQEVVEKVRRIVRKRRSTAAARELNLSSFLIFDCLHNAAAQRGLCLDMLLQMPQASRRQFHDDISIIVIMLNTPRGHIHAGLFMTDTDTDTDTHEESPTAPPLPQPQHHQPRHQQQPPASRSPTRRARAFEERFRKLRKSRKRLRKRMRSLGYERDAGEDGGGGDDVDDADYEGGRSLRERQEEHGSGGPLSLLRMLKKKLFHLKNKSRRRAGVAAERRKKRHAAVREKRGDSDSESSR